MYALLCDQLGLFGDGILDSTSAELLLNLAELTLDTTLLATQIPAPVAPDAAPQD